MKISYHMRKPGTGHRYLLWPQVRPRSRMGMPLVVIGREVRVGSSNFYDGSVLRETLRF